MCIPYARKLRFTINLLGFKERESISKTKATELIACHLVSMPSGSYRSDSAKAKGKLFININNMIIDNKSIPKAAGALYSLLILDKYDL